jgi:hypothetical protein
MKTRIAQLHFLKAIGTARKSTQSQLKPYETGLCDMARLSIIAVALVGKRKRAIGPATVRKHVRSPALTANHRGISQVTIIQATLSISAAQPASFFTNSIRIARRVTMTKTTSGNSCLQFSARHLSTPQ